MALIKVGARTCRNRNSLWAPHDKLFSQKSTHFSKHAYHCLICPVWLQLADREYHTSMTAFRFVWHLASVWTDPLHLFLWFYSLKVLLLFYFFPVLFSPFWSFYFLADILFSHLDCLGSPNVNINISESIFYCTYWQPYLFACYHYHCYYAWIGYNFSHILKLSEALWSTTLPVQACVEELERKHYLWATLWFQPQPTAKGSTGCCPKETSQKLPMSFS